jgi:hypothetical protein
MMVVIVCFDLAAIPYCPAIAASCLIAANFFPGKLFALAASLPQSQSWNPDCRHLNACGKVAAMYLTAARLRRTVECRHLAAITKLESRLPPSQCMRQGCCNLAAGYLNAVRLLPDDGLLAIRAPGPVAIYLLAVCLRQERRVAPSLLLSGLSNPERASLQQACC